MANSVSICHL